MKRGFRTIYRENEAEGYVPGDEAAHVAAAALAQRADAPTIARLTDVLTFLDEVGGQFHIYAFRAQAEDDVYQTEALIFDFETRDFKVQPAKPREELGGIPLTDAHLPGTPVEESVAIPVERPEEEADIDEGPLPEESEAAIEEPEPEPQGV